MGESSMVLVGTLGASGVCATTLGGAVKGAVRRVWWLRCPGGWMMGVRRGWGVGSAGGDIGACL